MPIVEGFVEHGDARGRQLGFPTANVASPELDDLDGVWAGLVEIDCERTAMATVSIGRRPTFYGGEGRCLLEAFLLDFSGDLYGKRLSVHLMHYLRPQQQYESADLLVEQLHEDVRNTRMRALKSHSLAIGPIPGLCEQEPTP